MADSYFDNEVSEDMLPMSCYKTKKDRAIDLVIFRANDFMIAWDSLAGPMDILDCTNGLRAAIQELEDCTKEK